MALQLRVEPSPAREFSRDNLSTLSPPRIASRLPGSFEEGLSEAVRHAHAVASPATDIGVLWQRLIDRRLVLVSAGSGVDGTYMVARTAMDFAAPNAPLSHIESAILARVLCGEQQKAVAIELGIACSTTSKWFTQALAKLHLDRRPIPLPLIVGAQAWAMGETPSVAARSATFQHRGADVVLLSVPHPNIVETLLTRAEQEVAKLLIAGHSRWEIALSRATSAQTVACQIRGIFAKFRLAGRYALVRRAVELEWFR